MMIIDEVWTSEKIVANYDASSLVTPIPIYHLNLYLMVISSIYVNVTIYCCCVTDPHEHHGRSPVNRLCLALSYTRHDLYSKSEKALKQ